MTPTLLGDTQRAGPYRLPAARLAAVQAAATERGWRILDLPAPPAGDTGDWLAGLAAPLALPAHFGANFDALYDCLCDSNCIADGGLILHFSATGPTDPEQTDTLIAVLQAAADEWRDAGRCLWSLFALPGLDLDPLPER